MRQLSLTVFLSWLLLHEAPVADDVVKYNLLQTEFQAENLALSKTGYSLVSVGVYVVNDVTKYTAIWNKSAPVSKVIDIGGPPLSLAMNQAKTEGFFPVTVNAYYSKSYGGIQLLFLLLKNNWEDARNVAVAGTAAQFESTITGQKQEGYSLIDVSAYFVNGYETYAAVFAKPKRNSITTTYRLSIGSAQLQQELDKQSATGFQPMRISGVEVGGQIRYTATFQRSINKLHVKHSLDENRLRNEINDRNSKGSSLIHLSGFTVNGQPRFVGIWTN